MTDENNGSANAGNPAGSQAVAENGSAASASVSPWGGLQSADNQALVKAKGWKSEDDGIASYRELESRMGSALTLPGKDAKPEDWDKFYSRVGRPEKADGYEFKRPEGLPEDLPYDDALAGKAKEWAHKAGLTPAQAQTMHDAFALENAERMKAHVATLTKAVEDTHNALVKDWGPDSSDGFKTKLEHANRALKKLNLIDDFKKSGILMPDGALTNAGLARAFAQIGEQMFAEDTFDGEAARGGPNPFKKESRNLSEISRLGKENPDRARALAREAGEDPDAWLGRIGR